MSVVREIRKTKQKWSLNPRGKAWSEDSNKFGQKMLEKMGWSRGKGLGAKENGTVEHIRVSYKNDTQGMGFKETDGQWTEHESNFNELLESLSGQKSNINEMKLTSLEKKSQNSKARVHYKKFTRGKDLSRCSEKDLASIFGKKSLKPVKIEENQEKIEENSFTHNAGSMVDYFKKKIPNFAKISSPVIVNNRDSESESEIRVGFGFTTPEKKKRKLSEDSIEGTPKKIKNEDEERIGLSNPAFDPLFNNVEVHKHVLNTIKEEENEEVDRKTDEEVCQNEEVKKKNGSMNSLSSLENGKKKKIKKEAVDNPNFQENDGEDGFVDDNYEVKRKKKKKNKEETVNVGISQDFEENSCQNGENFEVKRKKKKNTEDMALINPIFNGDSIETCYVNENFEVKRKKKKNKDEINQNFDEDSCQNGEKFEVKKKKKNKGDMALINPVFNGNDSIENSYVNEEFEVKRKKKNKHNMAVDNPNFNEEICEESTINNDFELKRKKKKKNKNEMAIDNPSFNDNCQTENNDNTEPETKKENIDNEPKFDLILNVTSTPSLLDVKSNNKGQLSSVKRRKSVRFSDVNEERIIPNKEEIQLRNELFDINTKVISNNLKESEGTRNRGFNKSEVMLDESITEISKKIDGFQAEIENDMNEAKIKYIGEIGNPDGGNEKLPDGVRLKFKYATFGKSPPWMRRHNTTLAKKGYKHMIKGDIVLGFKNTNLDEIEGYGIKVNRS